MYMVSCITAESRAMCSASSNMRLITGRAFRKLVLLNGIDGARRGWRRMELGNRLATRKAASNSAKKEHTAIASMLVEGSSVNARSGGESASKEDTN
jgi:hypothetical protein